MEERNFVLKGNICWSRDAETLETLESGFLVCEDGRSAGVYEELPARYCGYPLTDFGDRLVIPGLTDLHLHAPQYAFRGLGMDLELLDWLEEHAFPEEAKYRDLEYAGRAYSIFAEAMKRSATTRACVFATVHNPATLLLMDMLEETGLKTMVGKVNMDRNCPDYLREAGAGESAAATREWLAETARKGCQNVTPILTPRFIPSCSDELMRSLGAMARELGLSAQSHLSENQGEIAWVRELCPESNCYGEAYDRRGLFGGEVRTVMAHCVASSQAEVELMKERGVFIAHCPQSNTNLSSGIAPAARYLREGLNIGLGTDVAGGSGESVLRAAADAIQASKLRWRLVEERWKPLTVSEAFYMATAGGGAFFGKTGSFEQGYELDAVVFDDGRLSHPQPLTVRQRLERLVYLSEECSIEAKYAAGKRLF